MEEWKKTLMHQFKAQHTGFNDNQLEQLIERFASDYYRLSDPDDLYQNLKYLYAILQNVKNKIVYESDIETFSLLKYDYGLLKTTLKELYHANNHQSKLFRLYKDRDRQCFILGSYNNLKNSPRAVEANLTEPSWDELDIVKKNPGLKKRLHFSTGIKDNHSYIEVTILNSSILTLFNNLWEILELNSYSFIQIWLKEKLSRKIKNVFSISIHFFDNPSNTTISSMISDMERYLQRFLSYRSLFDIVGPAMVGPSSSHTAGANRIGQISRTLLDALVSQSQITAPKEIKIKLIGSFRDTGIGHHTPEAIIGGLSGLSTSDETMISKGLEAIKDKSAFRFFIRDIPVQFGGFIKGNQSDDDFYEADQNNNITEIIATGDDCETSITGFSIGGGNVEIRYINRQKLDENIDGKKEVKIKSRLLSNNGNKNRECVDVTIPALDKETVSPSEDYIPPFNTFEEMIEIFGDSINGNELIQKMIAVETQISGKQSHEIYDHLHHYWQIMKKAINKGIQDHSLSTFNLTGQDSARVLTAVENNILGLKDNIFGKAMAFAVSVNEINAKSGLIVACPTGGSCGILPGVLHAWEQTTEKYSTEEREKRILEALIVAGFFGMILFDDVPTAGADLGCQAEIGGGAAMTAAALAYLENASLNQMVEAFTLALKNSMGLVCDPVAGLVEVPCVKRNGIYAATAISAALYALAGVRSAISPDEVVLAVKEVGERMHDDYKETARGGLAQTRDGKKINRLFDKTTAEFFS